METGGRTGEELSSRVRFSSVVSRAGVGADTLRCRLQFTIVILPATHALANPRAICPRRIAFQLLKVKNRSGDWRSRGQIASGTCTPYGLAHRTS